MRRRRDQTRKLILDAAYVLFRKRGYTRVNVDEIAAEAHITKRTLYSHFDSKDALLEAVLETQHLLAIAAFETWGSKLKGTPKEIAATFFLELEQWAGRGRFAGSGFTRLAMELADLPGHPARRIASQHKRILEAKLANVLEKAGVKEPTKHARQMWLLSEGAMALMLIHGDREYSKSAMEAAISLLAR